jgi:transcription elongation factor GreB
MKSRPKDKNYITPGGIKKLTDEWSHLTKVERPEVTRTVTWAASLGDRSENADYIYGKKRLREIDRRLRFLSKRIEAAEVIDPLKVMAEKAQFGATLKTLNEEGLQKTYSIVGVDETKASTGLISWKSPIGKVLLGSSTGDIVRVQTPAGEYELEILEIYYRALATGVCDEN